MNFFNRAYKNVTRKTTKTILLALTFFLIGNLVILGLGVNNAANNAKKLTRSKMNPVVNYEVNYQAFQKYVDELEDEDARNNAYNNYPQIEKDIALEIAKDPRVKTFNAINYNVMNSIGFENVPVGNEEMKSKDNYSVSIDESGNSIKYVEPNIKVMSNLIPNMIELEDGTVSIVEGRFYNQEDLDNKSNVVVVSKELAELNNFKIGDSIKLSTENESNLKSQFGELNVNIDDLTTEFEIIGIYTTVKDVDTNSKSFEWMSPYENPKNTVYVPATSLASSQVKVQKIMRELLKQAHPEWFEDVESESEITEDSLLKPYKIVFLINDPLEVENFVADNKVRIAEFTRLDANNEKFKEISKPLDTLSLFSNIIVWTVSINAIVIITLVTALTLKTREFEIGVLLSIGVSKFKVILQLFTELLIVAVVGFSLAIFSGSLLAGKVGDTVLNYQQTKQAENENTNNYEYDWTYEDPSNYFSKVTQEDLLSEYKVSVSPLLIGEIYIFGLGLVFIAILIPSTMIMRLNPKQILLSTN